MDGQDAGQEAENMSSPREAGKATKLHLPMSCDPPGPNNPPKQLVWIVSGRFHCIITVPSIFQINLLHHYFSFLNLAVMRCAYSCR